jgi:hypothetical protein
LEQKQPTEHKAKNTHKEHTQKEPKQEIKTNPEHETADEIASTELATKLRSDGRFDFKLTKEYKIGVIAEAVSKNWNDWDDTNRKIVTGYFRDIYLRRADLDKGIDNVVLRAMLASKILNIDPTNALRILSSAVTNGSKAFKPGEFNLRLCKAIQTHIIQGDTPRYEKLFVSSHEEETKIILQHIVAAITGQHTDAKDPVFATIQLQFVRSLLNSDCFKILDNQSLFALTGAMRSSWPISMTDIVIEIYEQFAAKFPGENNPFASVISSATTVKIVPQTPLTLPNTAPAQNIPFASVASPSLVQSNEPILPLPVPPKPEPPPRNLNDPREVILIVTECLNKLEANIDTNQQEIATLKQTIEQLHAEKLRNDEVKDKKRQALEAVKEDNRKLREEITQLNSTIISKSGFIDSLQNEKSKLVLDLAASEGKVSELVSKHDQSVKHLSNSIDNVSKHMVNELKLSLEMDLKREFDELAHLPKDESCIFHMDVITAVFRKLRDKGIDVGGNQQ